MVFFAVLLGSVAQDGWLLRWPVKIVAALLLANEVDPEIPPSFQLMQTRRLGGVSRTLSEDYVVYILLNDLLILEPHDRCRRFMEAADTEDRRKKGRSYLFEMFEPDNPFVIAQKELFQLYQGDGDMVILLELLWRQQGCQAAW